MCTFFRKISLGYVDHICEKVEDVDESEWHFGNSIRLRKFTFFIFQIRWKITEILAPKVGSMSENEDGEEQEVETSQKGTFPVWEMSMKANCSCP